MAFGETVSEALRREVKEELGITDFVPEFLGRYIFESERERELVNVHRTTYYGPVIRNTDELADGRFFTPTEIRENLGKDLFTPNFEGEYSRFFL